MLLEKSEKENKICRRIRNISFVQKVFDCEAEIVKETPTRKIDGCFAAVKF